MRKTTGPLTNGKKAVVLYYSHRGKTAAYAREIAMYLWSKGLNVRLSSVSDAKPEDLQECDYLLSGCWTCGWFVVGQHPHTRWREFARQIRGRMDAAHTLLFTTYHIRTGSMRPRMKRALGIPATQQVPFLKSRNGRLSSVDKVLLDHFIGTPPIINYTKVISYEE